VIFDAHCHVVPDGLELDCPLPGEPELPRREWGEDSLLSNMDAAGVAAAAVMPFPVREALDHNAAVMNIARRHPHRFVPGVLLDQHTVQWIDAGAKFVKEHLYGLRTRKGLDDYWEGMLACESQGIPLLTHLGGVAGDTSAAHYSCVGTRLLDYANAWPALNVILAHGGINFEAPEWCKEWQEMVETIADLPNMNMDISWVKDPAAICGMLDILGPDRVLWGSDYPYESMHSSLQRIRSMDLPEGVLHKVLLGNSARLLG
jgi:predicted TIM-barrel fold metal-dependent hydrolase